MGKILTMTLWSLALADVAHAQQPCLVEIEGGGGYVFGSGVEDPGPSLLTLDATIVVWVTGRWGVAVRRVAGPGEDLYGAPVEIPDRTFLGLGHLHYWAMTARHRRSLSSDLGVEIGFGMMFGDKFEDIEMFRDPRIGRIRVPNGP